MRPDTQLVDSVDVGGEAAVTDEAARDHDAASMGTDPPEDEMVPPEDRQGARIETHVSGLCRRVIDARAPAHVTSDVDDLEPTSDDPNDRSTI